MSSFTVVIFWYVHEATINVIMLFWDALLTVIYICSYIYIFVTVKRRRTQFRDRNRSTNPHRLNLKVPFLLVLTLICFYFIPDLLLVTGIGRGHYTLFSPIFYFNYISKCTDLSVRNARV